MRFFPKRDSTVSKDSNEHVANEELETYSDTLQTEIDKKQKEHAEVQEKCEQGRTELHDIVQKVQKVKEEYDASISNLMSVKKDLNQRRMELDAIHREYRSVSDKIKVYETNAEVDMHLAKAKDSLMRTRDEARRVMQQRDELKVQTGREQDELSRIQDEIKQAGRQQQQQQDELSRIQDEIKQAGRQQQQQQDELSRIQDEIKQAGRQQQDEPSQVTDKTAHAAKHDDGALSGIQDEIKQAGRQRDELREQVEKERKGLSAIRKDLMVAKEHLDKTNAMLYNAKGELDKTAKTQETGVLTAKERAFIQGGAGHGGSAKIIEAASAVVSSLKSKLKAAQDQIDSVQALLEEEKERHKNTARELESLKNKKRTGPAKPKNNKDSA